MADGSDERVTETVQGPEYFPDALYALALGRRRPRVVVKADLLPAVSVLFSVTVLGVLLGWVWSRLAPPQQVRLFEGNQLLPLPVESYHRFDDMAIFLVLGLAAGLLTGIAVWMMRERRGPVVMFAAVLGSAVAAFLAAKLGVSFANGHYAVSGSPALGSVLSQAPVLESGWVLLIEPLGVALAYGVLVAWNGMPDLGRRLG